MHDSLKENKSRETSVDGEALLHVLLRLKKGDFTVRMPKVQTGLTGKISDTLNEIIDLIEGVANELERTRIIVGKEGKISQRAVLPAASGRWTAKISAVNELITDLVRPANEMTRVIGSIAKGDLSQRMKTEVEGKTLEGEFLQTSRIVNSMLDTLVAFTSEVTRVAREVGTEGKLGGQALVQGVSGIWKDLTDSVNVMANNLTSQVRNIAEVTTAVASGDLSKKITVDVRGEILQLKETINTMVDQLRAFASEVTRVAREVGTDGKLGGQAVVQGVGGTWKDLTDSVNTMASNLTSQVRNIAEVSASVANGNLNKKITVEVKGEIQELKDTINTMVDQLTLFASEVTRVAREVGTEGKLGGQADVKGVGGTWKDLTDNVNSMASNLTNQVRNIAEVTTSVANGDLSKTITVDARGEILELKNTINTMVDQLNSFSAEVTRVAREVGTEGKLGGQATVQGVGGTWKDLTDSVNMMGSNLTNQVRNIADVTTAVANGDLSKKITVDVQGEILELKNTINTMVDQLGSFASEVTRVAREVGTDGKLGGQADVKGVGGAWKDLTDSVNMMANNLTNQVRNIADVTTAVARGDLSKKVSVDVRGEILQLKDTMNIMIDQLGSFSSEVTRVAREVGTEGKLGGQADVKGVAGTWKDLTDSVNMMANNLTGQVRNIAEVTTAVARGDLSKKITVDVKGEILELKNTINTMVDQLNSFAFEVTRVAREVGTDGKLGGQAVVKDVGGTWKDLTDSVNMMASNLTSQVRNIAEVTTAVANGTLTKKITVEVQGEILELKDTINTMVEQLNSFASEVTRVAKEVGIDGKLGGQATVKGAGGTWKDLTDSVNMMASNLTGQVRNIAEVTTAVAKGDLSKKITVDVRGEILELKNTINTMVDQLNGFSSEVTRVAKEVGTEGKLGGQAEVKGVAGTWKDLTDSVNMMATNLTNQVRNIADVTTAVANGDLSKKITVVVKGEIQQLKNTINTMVEQLRTFASEVTRVSKEVGTEGKLGGQALVQGVGGTWKDLTDSVNMMASNLTAQVRNVAEVTTAVANGDLSRKITVDVKGEILELKNTINTMVDQLNGFASEVTRVAREVGTEGKLGGQADVKGVAGTWKDLTYNVNMMASNLTAQVRNIAEVTTAVATGDLSKKITVDVQGEILELKNTINTMVDQLSSFASEVTRVAREVGSEGKLGGQAIVRGVGGTWKDLTDNVNSMARNLTTQVRTIASIVTAVASGELKRKLVLEAKGEIADLAETINRMIDTLALFADQVTNVAKEVGIEGKLGGQANVPGAAGIWLDLTVNVNQLAGNLTTQVRAISEVATAVTKGDWTRTVTVQAAGEVATLKDIVNQMIGNLKETTYKNTEQDWLKTNLAKFTRMLQGQRDILAVSKTLLSELASLVGAQHGIFYQLDEDKNVLNLLSSYAYKERKSIASQFKIGEGLVGQCAFEKERILLTKVPSEYIQISSGLGEATPLNIAVLPVLFEKKVKAVIELASFNPFSEIHITFLEQLTEGIGIVLNTISATSRTEELLKGSQALTEELTESNKRLEQQAATLRQSEDLLKKQQGELQAANDELEERATLLSDQKKEVETKNSEVLRAQKLIEEKADQLTLTSKYKSEFLANMSHELRTPLNSLLILAKILADDPEKKLSAKQHEYAETIHSSGADLLGLINDILDLAKIESGTVTVDLNEIAFSEIKAYICRTFQQTAEKKNLNFEVKLNSNLPRTMRTDQKRLFQILKNLLSNAFKFTEEGGVDLEIATATEGWSKDCKSLNEADTVISFTVSDTGVGIDKSKHKLIFEAFQQAEAGTSRKYGGTGLGLSISREIVHMLCGEINLKSTLGTGSTFIVYLPLYYVSQTKQRKNDISIAATPSQKVNETLNEELSHQENASIFENAEAKVEFDDDRRSLLKGEPGRILLIVEDDQKFAKILRDMARDHGFKTLITNSVLGAIALAREYKPTAITLDLGLPDGNGWVVLDRIKHDQSIRHIPVHIITAVEESPLNGYKRGAIQFLKKPISEEALNKVFDGMIDHAEHPLRKLLLIEDNEPHLNAIIELLKGKDVEIKSARSAEEALRMLESDQFDCLVLDLGLPDMSGFEFLQKMKKQDLNPTPIIIYTGKELTEKEEIELMRFSETIVLKDAKSPERLLDETALFLHRISENLPTDKQKMLEKVSRLDPILSGKKALIVDDDMRNIFALSAILEGCQIKVEYCENAKDSIEKIRTGDFDILLTDIMMPVIDGYELIRSVRQMEKCKKLPIIALTAKAMKGDREKCLEAGASDYLAKPIDTDQLLSLMRVWLYR